MMRSISKEGAAGKSQGSGSRSSNNNVTTNHQTDTTNTNTTDPDASATTNNNNDNNNSSAAAGPFNHLPDSLALSLKVLKRYKREGRALTGEEAQIISSIADVVREFEIDIPARGPHTTNAPTATTITNSTSVVSSRLNAALSHAHQATNPNTTAAAAVPAGSEAAARSFSSSPSRQPPNPTIYTTTAAANNNSNSSTARDGGVTNTTNNLSSTDVHHLLSPKSNPLSNNVSNNNNSQPPTPASQSLAGIVSSVSAGGGGGGGEVLRIKDLISKLRRAADSGEVFKELMHKSATVDSLVEFAVQCNKASNSRYALASVIVSGMRAMAGRPPTSSHEPKSRPASASFNSSSQNVSTSRSASNSHTPRTVIGPAGSSSQHHHYLYGKHNMRLFLLNKSNEVLEDPLTGEMIGGISVGCECPAGGSGGGADPISLASNHTNYSSSSTVASLDRKTPRDAATAAVAVPSLATVVGDHGSTTTSAACIPAPSVTLPPTTLGALANAASGASQTASAEHSYTLQSPKRGSAPPSTAAAAAIPPSPPLVVTAAPDALKSGEESVAASSATNINNNTNGVGVSDNSVFGSTDLLIAPYSATQAQEDAESLALIVRAITDCFLNGASNENVERGGHLFLPMTVLPRKMAKI